MLKRFYPTLYIESIQKINYSKLKKLGKTTLLFDLDNTIAPYDIERPTEDIIDFFNRLSRENFNICIVSNNKGNRVEIFNESLKQCIYPKAGKPKKKGIMEAIKLCGGTLENAVIIGDQMFTDVWVANRLGIMSILIKPIANRDEFTVKLKRGVEKYVFKMYTKSRKNKNK
ncbi:MAG: YqeG family HAD IIIA-type phosphatase [Lachnospirales bacterium]